MTALCQMFGIQFSLSLLEEKIRYSAPSVTHGTIFLIYTEKMDVMKGFHSILKLLFTFKRMTYNLVLVFIPHHISNKNSPI